MRLPQEVVADRPRVMRRYQLAALIAVVALIVLLIVVVKAANVYADYLWFASLNLGQVWRSVVETKAALAGIFCGVFFLACLGSLLVAEHLAPSDIYSAPEHEIARRYRASIGRFRLATPAVVSFFLALVVGLGTKSQWQHWLLFLNGSNVGVKDPQFHRDIGFFLFRLPFLSFLVDWTLVALLVIFVMTALAHYLYGALRTQGSRPRIDSRAVAHLSFVLALMALVRALGYIFVDRYGLDLSTSGLVAGAGYTDVHVRLPALSMLAVCCFVGFVLLSYNVYHRSYVLPAVAFGIWVFVAIVLGLIYPALVQLFEVNPSQNAIELPYVQRNIAATRAAYGLDSVRAQRFDASNDLTAAAVDADSTTLSELPLWDPSVAARTYDNLQSLRGYYRLAGLATDRYELGKPGEKTLTPVVVGTRELSLAEEPRKTWVNEHLVYTHGYGLVMSPANATTGSGQPTFALAGVPQHSSDGAPKLHQPAVYFGDSSGTYVVADTREPELDYVSSNAGSKDSHYAGDGGVKLSGFWQQAAYAIKFHDVNLLVSREITSHSRLMYVQNVVQRVAKAAPFLQVDSHPYPVVANGQIYWLVDCYTTSDSYPYSEPASTGSLPLSSGLRGSYNYVRNSVKAVVNAYTGKVSFFSVGGHDPVLAAWERAYPGMIKPLREMAEISPVLLDHLRYPQDLLTVLSAEYGRYHFNSSPAQAAEFLSGQNSWSVAGASRKKAYTPTYELVRLPGRMDTEFVAVEPLVPQSTGKSQLLAGFVTADSSYRGYGRITCFELPGVSSNALGPALVSAKIEHVPSVSRQETLLGQQHSRIRLGPTLLVPIDDSLVYVEAFYVTSTDRSFPALEYVAADFGGDRVGFAPSLQTALSQIFSGQISGIGPSSSQTISAQIESDLALAYAAYEKSVTDGDHFRLGALQKDLKTMGRYLSTAHKLMAKERGGGTASSSTSTTAPSSKASSSEEPTSPSTTSSPKSISNGPANTAASRSGSTAVTAPAITSVNTTTIVPRVG